MMGLCHRYLHLHSKGDDTVAAPSQNQRKVLNRSYFLWHTELP